MKPKFAMHSALYAVLLYLSAAGLGASPLVAQVSTVEDFENEANPSTIFVEGGLNFSLSGSLVIRSCAACGSQGTSAYLETDFNGAPYAAGPVGTIFVPDGEAFVMEGLDLFLSTNGNINDSESGTVRFVGTRVDGTTVAAELTTLNDPLYSEGLSFTGTPLEGALLSALSIELIGSVNYLALDKFEFYSAPTTGVSFAVEAVILPEGQSGNQQFSFRVSRNSNTQANTVTVQTADGTAIAGQDYTSAGPTTLSFSAGGAFSQIFNVTVFGDEIFEQDEIFYVNLSAPTGGASLLLPQGRGVIQGDEEVCEDFEGESGSTFSEVLAFSATGYTTGDFAGFTRYMEGGSGSFTLTTPDRSFIFTQADFWTSSDSGNSFSGGNIQIVGTLAEGGTVVTTVTTVAPGGTDPGLPYDRISLQGTSLEGQALSSVAFNLQGGLNYVAIDNFKYAEVKGAPEVAVRSSTNTLLANGDSNIAIARGNDFGSVPQSGGAATLSFQIENAGELPLIISSVASNNPGFAISGLSGTTVQPAGSVSFEVSFDPGPGDCDSPQSAVIAIQSNDPNAPTFTFQVEAQPEDDIVPIVNCPGSIGPLVANSTCIGVAGDYTGNITASDNCASSLSITQSPIAGTELALGSTTMITLTATDDNNNSADCQYSLSVVDTTPPEVSGCSDIEVATDPGACTAIVNFAVSAVDNCSSVMVSQTQGLPSGSIFSLGITPVTIEYRDMASNLSTCTFSVTVEDNAPPELACPGPFVHTPNENCETVVPDVTILAGAVISSSTADFSGTQGQGNWSYGTYPAFDAGNFSLLPNYTGFVWNSPGSNLDFPQLDPNGGHPSLDNLNWAVRRWTSPFTGQVAVSGSFFDRDGNCGDGAHVRILKNGVQEYEYLNIPLASENYSFTLDVQAGDVLDFAIDPKFDASCDDTHFVAEISAVTGATAVDNCSSATLSQMPAAGTVVSGNTSIRLTASDALGNETFCDISLNLLDEEPPTASCKNFTLELDAIGQGVLLAGDINDGSSDNCGIGSLSSSPALFTCADIGMVTVALTVTDVNGNSSSCQATVTVVDHVNPTALCQPQTVFLDGTGAGSLTANDIDNGSGDACGLSGLSLDISSFGCADVGANTVELTATDVNGNSSSCQATVTVLDTISPTALCQPQTVFLDGTGAGSLTANDIDNGSGDACGLSGLSLDISSFGCADVGANTVELTATDVNGNSNSCQATVTVLDTISPTALCQPQTVFLDGTGAGSLTANDIDNGSGDACGLSGLSLDISSFGCADVGENTVELTATDVNGNSNSCQATVTVLDTISPTALCAIGIEIALDENGEAVIMASDVDGGSFDNCGIGFSTVQPNMVACNDAGSLAVELTVQDQNGNQSSCQANVMVVDNAPPVANCRDISVELNANGEAQITAAQIDNGSTDNCGVQMRALDQEQFSCFDLGQQNVMLTVTDAAMNSSTCNATVTVQNTAFPAACDLLSLSIQGTSEAGSPESGDGSAGNEREMLIGEIVTFRYTLNIPEGTEGAMAIATALPQGLSYLPGTVQFSTVADNSLLFNSNVVAGSPLIFELSDIQNNDSDANAEAIEVTFDAFVENIPAINAGSTLSVQGELSVGGAPFSSSEPRALRVGEPNLQMLLFQLDDYAGGAVTEGDAGDEYVYTVRLENTGSAPAYDVALEGMMPQEFAEQYGAIITTGPAGSGFTYDTGAGLWNFSWNEIGAGQSVSATIRFRVKGTVRPGDAWAGTIDVAYTSLPGVNTGERNGSDGPGGALNDYAVSGPLPTFTVPEPEVAKQVEHPSQVPVADFFGGSYSDSSSDPTTNIARFNPAVMEAAIGETFSYLVTATFPEGVTADFTMIDLVSPNGHTGGLQNRVLDMLSAEVIFVGSNLSGPGIEPLGTLFLVEDSNPSDGDGTRTQLWLGGGRDVVNTADNVEDDNDRYIIRITVRVDDEDEAGGGADDVPNVSNSDGNTAGNRLQYQWLNSDETQFTRNIVAPVEIAEPAIALEKEVISTNGLGSIVNGNLEDAFPGDEVTFRITVGNNGNATAYDWGISETLDTAALQIANVSSVNTNSTSGVLNGMFFVNIDALEPGESATITVEAVIKPTVALGGTYVNAANAIAKSQPSNGMDIRLYNASSQASVSIIDCLVSIAEVMVTDEGCPGAEDGIIMVSASSTTGNDLTYALTGPASATNSTGLFDDLPSGEYSVTVSDDGVAGCDASQMNIIIAAGVDNVAPTAICQNAVVQLDADGMGSVTASDIDNGSTDACGIASLMLDVTAFGCAEVGMNTVTLTVTDENSNVSMCTATVTVEDNVAPTAICQNAVVQLDADGMGSITASDIDNGSTDACGIS
ncbi:HYR domain-containing protein, partial [Phaeodactylibacter luteus]